MAAGLDAIVGLVVEEVTCGLWFYLDQFFFLFCANITYTQKELLLLEEEAKSSNVKRRKKLKSQCKFSPLLLPSLY